MTKFSWEEFLNEKNYIAIHCKTENEAKDFCRKMHEHGLKWCTGESYLHKTDWNNYKEDTCYGNHGTYGTIGAYKHSLCYTYTVFEYSDIFDEDRVETIEEFIERTRGVNII